MAVQGKGAVRTWLDWLSPEQGAGDAIHLSGEQNIENTNQTAPEEGVFVLRKFIGKQVGVTKPLLVVFSLLLLSAVLFRVSSRWNPIKLRSSRLSSHIEWASLYVYGHIMRIYMDDLNDAEEEMNKEWDASPKFVRKAFQRQFTPSLSDSQALTKDPLATINDHVDQMLECKFPLDSSAKVQSDFLQHVQLLLTTCRMVTLRLKELKSSVSLENELEGHDRDSGVGEFFGISPSMKADDFLANMGMVESERRQSVEGEIVETNDVKVPLSFPVHEEPGSNSLLKGSFGISSSMKADDFLDGVGIVGSGRRQFVGGKVAQGDGLEVARSSPVHDEHDSNSDTEHIFSRSVSMKTDEFLGFAGMVGSERRQSVDIKSAEQLLDLLLEAEKRNVCNLEARYYFEHFLQPSGEDDAFTATPSTAKHQIPYNGKPFRTGALAQAAAQIFREYEGNTNYRRIRKIHQIAGKWTNESVLEATKQQEKENWYNFQHRLHNRREHMRALLKKGIEYDDLEMIALFLL
ncbi:hypothetical protein EMWEY_00059180 [Eimeria maxima]|uniref:Uncharacterized protein n=1 Tax=Eimeria maxima TaxID=5804 RepID=U6M9X2_EIMMA|nr:hypothetical protein EMWEY_00059180 [Eimeria maxima]CDJ59843.1 hypothetical protein EMWEY_00059180 [Eimeria maxima]